MTKSSKNNKAAHATRSGAACFTAPAEAPASFLAVAQRLGDALADAYCHPNCPADVRDAVCELETRIFNHNPDLEVSLRHGFGQRLVGMLKDRPQPQPHAAGAWKRKGRRIV